MWFITALINIDQLKTAMVQQSDSNSISSTQDLLKRTLTVHAHFLSYCLMPILGKKCWHLEMLFLSYYLTFHYGQIFQVLTKYYMDLKNFEMTCLDYFIIGLRKEQIRDRIQIYLNSFSFFLGSIYQFLSITCWKTLKT